MKILLDENVPSLVLESLERVLIGHTVEHVDSLKWKSKKDRFLLPDAAARGFQMFVTKDTGQLSDPAETRAVKKSGMHWVSFRQRDGRVALGLAMGAVIAGVPPLVDELDGRAQTVARIRSLASSARWEIVPVNELSYWKG